MSQTTHHHLESAPVLGPPLFPFQFKNRQDKQTKGPVQSRQAKTTLTLTIKARVDMGNVLEGNNVAEIPTALRAYRKST